MKKLFVAVLYGIAGFGMFWFFYGFFEFPHAPIRPCGEGRFCGKGGQLYSNDYYEYFLFWQNILFISFFFMCLALITLRAITGKNPFDIFRLRRNSQFTERGNRSASPTEEIQKLLEALSGMVAQWCTQKDGILDSCSLGAAAEAMRLLALYGIIEIQHDYGRRVVGKWSEGQNPFPGCL